MPYAIDQYARMDRLMPDGIPKYVRIYDLGTDCTVADRFTIVFGRMGQEGSNKDKPLDRGFPYIVMDERPTHPQGYCQTGWDFDVLGPIDREGSKRLGERIGFHGLPDAGREIVLDMYLDLWGVRPYYEARIYEARKTATIIGALRILQFEREWKATFTTVYEAQMDVLTDGGTLEPLTSVEIDELCEKLNVGEESL